ncbi:unnamed protein product [Brassicogethes aeneus]|uniref:Nucleoside 2-deoxyribosyltransferase like protein n=1 Tax=Brassicogethes aeneus TaxID=1431903 RepID=A0A9P0BB40_BRAAE|nr:unnamed protein product [Brassicogethes aeneus]
MVQQKKKQVYDAICTHLKGNNTLHIPEDNVQNILNELQLYPSKAQVSKMLQCAKRYNKNGASDSITFGEFCVFIREMQNQPPIHHRKTSIHKANNKFKSNFQVFLGGSCNPTTWRADTAIPELQKHGISFYNPQVSMWAPELVEQEFNAKQTASLLLFVIDSQTRSTVGMIEVAYLVASGRCVVIVAQPFKKNQTIMGETITDEEYIDLVEGQTCLLHLVKSRGVKIHSDLPSALQCTANFFKNASTSNATPEDQITHKLKRLRQEYDSYGGQVSVDKVLETCRRLTNRKVEAEEVKHYLNGSQPGGATALPFDRYLTLMAELDGCDMCSSEVWAKTTNNNSCDPHNDARLERPLTSTASTTTNGTSSPRYDVFLGGSTRSRVDWRRDVAIPKLKVHGLRYYNPTIRETGGHEGGRAAIGDADVSEWREAIDESRVLMFAIGDDTRSLATMVLAAHHLATAPERVVLCVQHLAADKPCLVHGEVMTKNAVKDYNRARVYLTDLAHRRQVKVFEDIAEAVQEAINKSLR